VALDGASSAVLRLFTAASCFVYSSGRTIIQVVAANNLIKFSIVHAICLANRPMQFTAHLNPLLKRVMPG
jgi:hypothetical protein